MWRVEGKRPRLDLADREVPLRTGQPLREEALGTLSVGIGDEGEPLAEPQGRLDRVGQTRTLGLGLRATADHETVDDDLDAVLFHLVEGDVLGKVADDAVDADARESAAAGGGEELLVLALAIADERAEDEDARALGHGADLVDDLLDGLRDDGDPVVGAVRDADPREEESQVVVDLGDRSDGGPRVARRAFLVDRDRGREPLDEVDVRLLHLPEELPRVGGERLHVAALALRVDRVEGERRFPRPGEARDDDELVPRYPDVDVLEVVFPRALDVDVVERHQATAGIGGVVRSVRWTSQRYASQSGSAARPPESDSPAPCRNENGCAGTTTKESA